MTTSAETQHSARSRYLLIALVFAGTALSYLDRQVLALLKPTLVSTFSWTDQEFAHLGSAFTFATAAAVLFSGWLVDRFGVRVAYGAAVALWSLAGMGHAAAATVSEFVMARIVLALGESVSGPATVKSTAQYLPVEERSLGLGIIAAAPSIGAIVAPLTIPVIAVLVGWQAAFLMTGALGFVWVWLWFLGTRHLKNVQKAAPVAQNNWQIFGELLRDRRTWGITGAKMLADMVWWFMLFWIPDLFSRVFHLSQAELGAPVALTYIMAAGGAISSGLLFPALLRRGFTVNTARKTSMVIFGLLILPLPLALAMPSPWLAALLIGLALFAHNGFVTNIFGATADIIPLNRVATVTGLGSVCGNLSGMAMIEFAGWSLTNGYGYYPMFAIASGAYLAGTLVLHLMVRNLVPASELGD
ncbi:MFS transporter [Novosphingobium flavum]|uniref:MFS transporter n=2 Tax=Novosphingobium flavum TaxID=1778672 RepID=A0A7X1KMK3_9SPHN|nr:MFS transporter [Novosphingobium flavum]MBC2666719.1 MFS transporter [Novosphingobium flavum]